MRDQGPEVRCKRSEVRGQKSENQKVREKVTF